jgi:hypothetical protein
MDYQDTARIRRTYIIENTYLDSAYCLLSILHKLGSKEFQHKLEATIGMDQIIHYGERVRTEIFKARKETIGARVWRTLKLES